MGLTFHQPWKVRHDSLKAAARRIEDEFAAVKGQEDRLLLDLEPVLSRLRQDPSPTALSDLDRLDCDAREIMHKLYEVTQALMTVQMEIGAALPECEEEEAAADANATAAAVRAQQRKVRESMSRLLGVSRRDPNPLHYFTPCRAIVL